MKNAFGDFIGITTPEAALAASLKHAEFSLHPSRESVFRDLFPRGSEIDGITMEVITRWLQALSTQSAESASDSGGEQVTGAVLIGLAGALVDPDTIPGSPLQLPGTSPETSELSRTSELHDIFAPPPSKPQPPRLSDTASEFMATVVREVLARGFENENRRIAQLNSTILDTVRRLSENGRYIVIIGGTTRFSNALLDIITAEGSGLHCEHSQELDKQNFYRIPLDKWVAFCRIQFPEMMEGK